MLNLNKNNLIKRLNYFKRIFVVFLKLIFCKKILDQIMLVQLYRHQFIKIQDKFDFSAI